VSAKIQRLRVTYARGSEVRYISHLDMMRFWERALRRARLPIAYSEGFTPHPQIAMATPLPFGMTGRAELLDVFLAEPLDAGDFQARLQAQSPVGMRLTAVTEVLISGPSLQSLVRVAEYELSLDLSLDIAAFEQRIAAFLAATSFPWEHVREKETRRYDLRPLVLSLRLERDLTCSRLITGLQSEERGTGRPDQLANALGVAENVVSTERTALVLADDASSVSAGM